MHSNGTGAGQIRFAFAGYFAAPISDLGCK